MVTLTVTKKQDLILRPCFFCVLRGLSITEMKPQILSLCSQRKGSARSSKMVLSIVFRKFVSDKMKQCAGTPATERLRSAYLP